MENQKERLAENLKQAGWQITEVETDEWWVREMWRLQSGEATAFVTFLVDPADMELVWAVLATQNKPIDYAGEPPRFVLPFQRFETDLIEFNNFVSDLRDIKN